MEKRLLILGTAVGLLGAILIGQKTAAQEKVLWPEEQMDLEGTSRGPHYVYMTKEERAEYIRHYQRDPEGKKEFAKIRERADGIIRGEARSQHVSELVIAYVVTGEKKYFEAWRDRFLAESNWLNAKYPTAMDMAKAYGPTIRFIWGNELNARDYDMLVEHLSDRDEKLFRWKLKRYSDALRIWKVDTENVTGQGEGTNMAARTISNTSPQWYVIGYDDCIKWAISHKPAGGRDGPGGLLQWMRPMRDKRVWGEAPIYQWYVGDGIMHLAERAWRYDGTDVWNMVAPNGTKPGNVVDGAIDMAFPLERTGIGVGSIRMANFGEEGTSLFQDQWLNYGGGYRACWQHILRCVYSASKDPGYGWLASVNEGIGDREGTLPIDPEKVSPPPAASVVWPSAGVAMLRADESPGYWMGRGLAMQIMGGEKRRSAPGDSFSIRLHGAGRMLYPDWSMTYYEVYEDVGWQRSGIRRNSVLIDGRETSVHRTNWRHAFWPEVKYLSLRGSRYGHDRSERAFMMTKEYLLDVVDMTVGDDLSPDLHYYPGAGSRKQYRGWSRAGLWDENGTLPNSHTFDYILHGIGQQFSSHWSRFRPSTEITTEKWSHRWFDNERKCEMGDETFTVDWVQRSGGYERRLGMYKSFGDEWFADRAAVRLHMLGSPNTKVYTLQAPMGDGGHYTERELPRPPTHVVNPDDHPEMTLKTLIVRREGKDAQFAALHEPYQDKATIHRFEYLHRPDVAEDVRAVGVKVTASEYVDRLYLTLGLSGYTREDGVQEKRVAPDAESRELPQVTVASDRDQSEFVRFTGQTYFRDQGDTLTVRGDARAFCMDAPTVTTVVLNETKVEFRRNGKYVLYGDAKPSNTITLPDKPEASPVPVELALPQRNVNIDANHGGWLVVRIINRVAEPAQGMVTVKPGPGLAVSAPRPFSDLPPEHRMDYGFELKPEGAQPGALVPVEITVSASTGEAIKSYSIKTQVAVGIVVNEVPFTFKIPAYDLEEGLPGKPKPTDEWQVRKFDYIQVRAPGYTIKVDKFSGGVRWIMDSTGLLRSSLSAYPYAYARVDSDESWRYLHEGQGQAISGPWLREAEYQGLSKNKDGTPVLKFSSLNGDSRWEYTLTPTSAGSAGYRTIDAPGIAEQDGLGFKVPDAPWWKEDPVSLWPAYKIETEAAQVPEKEKPKNLLEGLTPQLEIPDEVEATGGVYLDEEHQFYGQTAICFDLEKLRGFGELKHFVTAKWPVPLIRDKRYRFSLRMRHENVDNHTLHQAIYTLSNAGIWVSDEADRMMYWPKPVCHWMMVEGRVSRCREDGNMYARIGVPGDQAQTGKVWLSGFLVEPFD